MKPISILLLLMTPFLSFAQEKGQEIEVTIINGITGAPIPKCYAYLLKDHDHWIDIERANDQGILKLETAEDTDKKSSYQIEVTYSGFQQVVQEVDVFRRKHRNITVTLFPDSNYHEIRNDLMYVGCSSISFGEYHPQTPHSLDDLPVEIQTKLKAHLIERLGEEYYAKLWLNDGQIVNLDRLYKVEPNAYNYRWTPYSYYLCFAFEDTLNNVGEYNAKIVLDASGNVVEEIQLPEVAKYPEKAKILSLDSIKAIATAQNAFPEGAEISLSYDNKTASITWLVSSSVFRPDHTLSSITWVFDAHSGELIRKGGSGGIWD